MSDISLKSDYLRQTEPLRIRLEWSTRFAMDLHLIASITMEGTNAACCATVSKNQHRWTWGEINGCSTLMRTFITDPQGSWRKVMFSQACVILYLCSHVPSGGRVSLVPCPCETVGILGRRVSGSRVSRGYGIWGGRVSRGVGYRG